MLVTLLCKLSHERDIEKFPTIRHKHHTTAKNPGNKRNRRKTT